MQMRAPAQRTKLQPRGKGAGPFPADKSKKGGALKMTLPLPQPHREGKVTELKAQALPNNSETHTPLGEPDCLLKGQEPLLS